MKNYLTVKEFAAAAHVSPQTIYKQINGRLAPYVITIKGQKRISEEALKEYYIEEEQEQLESTQKQPESTQDQLDSIQEQPESTREQPESTADKQPESTQEGQIEALNRLISLVQKELEEKDKQLAVKDKQIQELNDRLAEALQLTKGQQYIAAADKTKALLEVDESKAAAANESETVVEKPLPKKSFFQWLFGR